MRNEEHKLQVTLVKYLRYNGILCFSVPNHGIRSPRMGAYYKEEGMLAGVADLVLLFEKRCIFVEVKIEKQKQSESQKKFQNYVESLGFEYWVIRNLENLIEKINEKRQLS